MAYRPSGHTGSSGRLLTRREFVRSAGVAGLAAVMVSAAPFQPPRSFVVSRHERSLRGLDGPLRLALLTDLLRAGVATITAASRGRARPPYLGEEELERWVAATLREEPDVVLLGGDLVDQRYRGDLSELARHLPRLAAPLGVYAVLGNHDHARFRRIDALTDMLAAAGVTLLANDAARLREDLVLAGIDDLRVGRPDLDATLAAARRSGGSARGADNGSRRTS